MGWDDDECLLCLCLVCSGLQPCAGREFFARGSDPGVRHRRYTAKGITPHDDPVAATILF